MKTTFLQMWKPKWQKQDINKIRQAGEKSTSSYLQSWVLCFSFIPTLFFSYQEKVSITFRRRSRNSVSEELEKINGHNCLSFSLEKEIQGVCCATLFVHSFCLYSSCSLNLKLLVLQTHNFKD